MVGVVGVVGVAAVKFTVAEAVSVPLAAVVVFCESSSGWIM